MRRRQRGLDFQVSHQQQIENVQGIVRLDHNNRAAAWRSEHELSTQIPVLSREFMLAAPSGRTIVVVQPDDTLNIFDLLLVTDLEIKPSLATAHTNGPPKG